MGNPMCKLCGTRGEAEAPPRVCRVTHARAYPGWCRYVRHGVRSRGEEETFQVHQVRGTTKNTKHICIKAPRTSHRKPETALLGGCTVRTPGSRAKYEDFYEVTPVLDKALSGDPGYLPLELRRNKCIVIFRIFPISRSADLATQLPYLFTSSKPFLCPLLRQGGELEGPLCDRSSPFVFFAEYLTPAFLLSGKPKMLERLWAL